MTAGVEMRGLGGRGELGAYGGCDLLVPISQDVREEARVTTYLGLGASRRGPPGHPPPVCSPSLQGSLPWYGNRSLQTEMYGN